MRSGALLVLLFLACVAGFALGAAACTPADREAVAPLVEPASRWTCIILRAVSTSGTLDEVCATADDLAPYVSDLLAQRAAGELEPRGVARVAFALPAPARRVPRRRCVSWLPIASFRDAGLSTDDGGDSGR